MSATYGADITDHEHDHPAKFSPVILDRIAELLPAHALADDIGRPGKPLRILDPFAGVGRVHLLRDLYNLPVATTGIELEPEFASGHPRTIVGDSRDVGALEVGEVDAIVTSPCYGNRMADSFVAKDASRRHTYHHNLGRKPSTGSAAVMRWGPQYRRLHLDVYRSCADALTRPGLVVLNVSNHLELIRKGGPRVEWPVVEWHLKAWLHLGGLLRRVEPIATPRQGHGANGDVRVDAEFLLVFVLPEHPAPER